VLTFMFAGFLLGQCEVAGIYGTETDLLELDSARSGLRHALVASTAQAGDLRRMKHEKSRANLRWQTKDSVVRFALALPHNASR